MGLLIGNMNFIFLAFSSAVLFVAGYCYARQSDKLKRCANKLILSFTAFLLFFAALKSGLQYYLWSQTAPGKFLLPPHQPPAYFLRYAFTHFWLSIIISVILSFLFFLFLRAAGRKRPWLFLDGETELGFVCALMAGWPGFVLFLPLVFIVILPLSLFRRLVLKEERTTMGAAFLLAAGITLFFGNYFINRLGLGVLRI